MTINSKKIALPVIIFSAVFIGLLLISFVPTNESQPVQIHLAQTEKEMLIPIPVPTEPLGESFFENTLLGQDILAFIHCFEICIDARSAVEKRIKETGIDPTPIFVNILYLGLPGNLEYLSERAKLQIILLFREGDTRAIPHLLPLLKDPNSTRRGYAANTIGLISQDDEVFYAILPLLRDPEPTVRTSVALRLGRMGRPEALSKLLFALSFESNVDVKRAMSDAIKILEKVPLTPSPAVADDANMIKSIKTTSSGIEIELYSTKPFPVRALPAVLRINTKEFTASRYPEVSNIEQARMQLNTLIFTLTLDEFAQINTGDSVVVQYGTGELHGDQWDFGMLDKSMLDK